MRPPSPPISSRQKQLIVNRGLLQVGTSRIGRQCARSLSEFGPRRGARTRSAVFHALLAEYCDSKGVVITLSALAKKVRRSKLTVWSAVRWLRDHGLGKTSRPSRGLPLRLAFLFPPTKKVKHRPSPVDRYRRRLKRAAQLGRCDPSDIEAMVLEYAIAIEKKSLSQQDRLW